MPISNSIAPRQLSDGNSQGTILGYPQNVIMPDGVPDKIGFYGATPVAQAAPTGNTHTVAAGATTNVFTNTTFDGGTGTTAYTIGDLVAVLKGLGLIKL
jgi:hypothetical protein